MILIATDKEKVRDRWREAVPPDIDVSYVSDCDHLIGALSRERPEMALIHLSLPGLEDGDGIAMLRARHPQTKLLVFSDTPTESEGLRLLRIGMHGYLNTYTARDLVSKAVNVVSQGEIWIGRRLMLHLIDELRQAQAGESAAPITDHDGVELLTPRELQIAMMVAQGEVNKSIANHMGITERTVKAHLSSVFRKTGTHNRVHLALLLSTANQPLAEDLSEN